MEAPWSREVRIVEHISLDGAIEVREWPRTPAVLSARVRRGVLPATETAPVVRTVRTHLGGRLVAYLAGPCRRLVTIHPFDDGNGRIARAIADWQLARSENSAQRFYSMSAQIRLERNAYYDILERTQQGPLDVTPWLAWFLECLGRAFDTTDTTLTTVLRKARFWERATRLTVNDRQRLVLNRLLDGFTGKLTTQKWALLAKSSHDTALRDIQGLIEQGLLKKNEGGGRSTSYSLVLDNTSAA